MRKLRPYQVKAIDFVKSREQAGLFVDMGLGKTASMLHAALSLPKPILLVGPIRVIETVWEQETEEWPNLDGKFKFSLVRGTPKQRAKALEAEADIYLVNPEMLHEAIDQKEWKTLIIDESSMFKNPSTQRFKRLRKHLKKIPRRYILTGTPAPNGLLNLWSQIFILDLGERLTTSYYRFRQRFFHQTDWQGYVWEPLPGARERVLELISDLILTIEAEGNLPPREAIHNRVYVNLPPKARSAYDAMEAVCLSVLENEETVTAATAAAATMKLRQMASGFVYNDEAETEHLHDEKVKALHEILDGSSSPVIVVYQFQHELAALQAAFPEGRTIKEKGVVEDWNRGEVPILFLHPQSGGHGLNLQHGGHTMAIFSGTYSAEQMSQTKARIDRQGQKFPVIFHYLLARNTIDEVILSVLEGKVKAERDVINLIKEYADAKTNRS